MATAMTHLSVSLDGFIPIPSDQVRPWFDWYDNGDVALRAPEVMTFGGVRGERGYLRGLHVNASGGATSR